MFTLYPVQEGCACDIASLFEFQCRLSSKAMSTLWNAFYKNIIAKPHSQLGRQCSPKRTSLAEPRSVSVVLMAVSVCPHRGPGGLPTQGKGLGRGAGSGSDASGSMLVMGRPVSHPPSRLLSPAGLPGKDK